MADIDIDPFGEHDRTESRPDENIPLSLVTPVEEDQFGNQNVNKKHHSEGCQAREQDLKLHL